jgi:hypothetical protein
MFPAKIHHRRVVVGQGRKLDIRLDGAVGHLDGWDIPDTHRDFIGELMPDVANDPHRAGGVVGNLNDTDAAGNDSAG